MTRRHKRTERDAGVKVVLGPRDEALLRALARFRIAATSDVTHLFFDDTRRDTAGKRLRRLFDASYVDVHPRGMHEESVYALGEVGRRWAEDRGLACGRVPAQPWDHHLAIVRAWVRLARALHGHPSLRLVRVDPDWVLRREHAGLSVPVVPDAAVEIDRQVGERSERVRIALEIDLGSERLAVLERKLSAYEPSMFFDGAGSVLVAVALANAGGRRTASVGRLVGACWSGASVVCDQSEWPGALITRITGAPPAPLADSPDSKGRDDAATPCPADAVHTQGEGPSR